MTGSRLPSCRAAIASSPESTWTRLWLALIPNTTRLWLWPPDAVPTNPTASRTIPKNIENGLAIPCLLALESTSLFACRALSFLRREAQALEEHVGVDEPLDAGAAHLGSSGLQEYHRGHPGDFVFPAPALRLGRVVARQIHAKGAERPRCLTDAIVGEGIALQFVAGSAPVGGEVEHRRSSARERGLERLGRELLEGDPLGRRGDDHHDARDRGGCATQALEPAEARLLLSALLEESEIHPTQGQRRGRYPNPPTRRQREQRIERAECQEDHAEHLLHPHHPFTGPGERLDQVREGGEHQVRRTEPHREHEKRGESEPGVALGTHQGEQRHYRWSHARRREDSYHEPREKRPDRAGGGGAAEAREQRRRRLDLVEGGHREREADQKHAHSPQDQRGLEHPPKQP